jgi:predicted XRE-type DNA-binding protein
VFADLGFPDADKELLKAQLASAIARAIQMRGLTQVEAAAVLGTTQPKVSLLLRGRTENITVSRLIGHLNALGQDVYVGVGPAPTAHAVGVTLVGPFPSALARSHAVHGGSGGRSAARARTVARTLAGRKRRRASGSQGR